MGYKRFKQYTNIIIRNTIINKANIEYAPIKSSGNSRDRIILF